MNKATVKLTPKQEKFCQVFIETGNASEAYRQAYAVSFSEGIKSGRIVFHPSTGLLVRHG